MTTPKTLLSTERLLARTADDAGCLVWLGGAILGRYPVTRLDGRVVLVRRALHELLHGTIPHGSIVHMTCGTPLCINPECMQITTHKTLAKANGAKGLMSGPVRSAAIAKAKRNGPQGKLTPQAVADIRSSNEPGRVLAARWGVAQAHISKVQLHKAQRDFSNPFLGLGARA